VSINADAKLYAGLFDKDQGAKLVIDPKRKAYVHLIKGELEVNGHQLKAGDALMFEQEEKVVLSNGRSAEVLVFDLSP
jgi:redox-sensitive bicupin YhaK (pirin superfamily)